MLLSFGVQKSGTNGTEGAKAYHAFLNKKCDGVMYRKRWRGEPDQRQKRPKYEGDGFGRLDSSIHYCSVWYILVQQFYPTMTQYSALERIVLQFSHSECDGVMQKDNLQAPTMQANIYLPKTGGLFIACPFSYFQQHSSLLGKWIRDNQGNRIDLDCIDHLEEVVLTVNVLGAEIPVELSNDFQQRLLQYFNLDIPRNEAAYLNFDCYAFVSFIANIKYFPTDPELSYYEGEPEVGDIVVLTNSEMLPHLDLHSIKHWAIFLGYGCYLSKFGMTGYGTHSNLAVMNLQGMQAIYQSPFSYIAKPTANAQPWDGYTGHLKR